MHQASDDRAYFIRLEKRLNEEKSKIIQLENILFQKEDLEKLDLFGKIYSKIDKLDRSRLLEEEKLKVKVSEQRIDIDKLLKSQKVGTSRLDL